MSSLVNLLIFSLPRPSKNKYGAFLIISNFSLNKDLKKLYKVDNELQAESFVDLIKYMMDACELVGLNNFN